MTDRRKPGGRREPPGGRPPLPPEERRVKVSISISPEVRQWLTGQRERPNEPISRVIERLLTRLKTSE